MSFYKLGVTLRDSLGDPARGLDATNCPARLRDSAGDPARGLGAANCPASLRDSASDPTRGLGAATTRRVSATPPATLLGGWAPQLLGVSPQLHERPWSGAGRRNYSACLRDSASGPGHVTPGL